MRRVCCRGERSDEVEVELRGGSDGAFLPVAGLIPVWEALRGLHAPAVRRIAASSYVATPHSRCFIHCYAASQTAYIYQLFSLSFGHIAFTHPADIFTSIAAS
jgi:hypothetical protein